MPGEPQKVIAKRYEIISKLGSGGTGSVFLALDITLKREVAIKLLNPELVNPDSARRFQLEAKTASTLSHPNLINVLDFGISSNNEIYLVMDYLKGKTLAQYIEQNGPIPIEEAAPIFVQICEGIAYAHKQRILHRDLKSTNVMVTDENSECPRVLILDFGLAKRTEDGSITKTGIVIGSPLYMSPEHATGQDLDGRADIYSMGCLMYHALTGVYPIEGDTVLDTIMKQTNETAPSLKNGLPAGEFSNELEEVIAKCLMKDRSKRFGSMTELLDEIKSLPEIQEVERWSLEPPKQEVLPLEKVSERRTRLVAGLAGLLALVIVLTTAYMITRQYLEPVTHIRLETGQPFQLISPRTRTRTWENMPWNDGIVWKKRFGISDDDLADPKQMKGIEYLSLYVETISRKGLESISHLPLKGIYMKENRNVHDCDLAILGRISTLEVLCLDNNEQFTDTGLASLKNLENLRLLGLSDNNFTDKAFDTISSFSKLEVLYIDGLRNVSGSGLSQLANLKHLEKLCLDLNNQIPSKYLESVGQIKSLKTLYMCDTHANGDVLQRLSNLPLLSEIDVKRTDIRDKDVPLFQKIPSLKVLYISDNNLSPAVFFPLKAQKKFKVVEKERLPIEILNRLTNP